jgi:hypothetical protein
MEHSLPRGGLFAFTCGQRFNARGVRFVFSQKKCFGYLTKKFLVGMLLTMIYKLWTELRRVVKAFCRRTTQSHTDTGLRLIALHGSRSIAYNGSCVAPNAGRLFALDSGLRDGAALYTPGISVPPPPLRTLSCKFPFLSYIYTILAVLRAVRVSLREIRAALCAINRALCAM